MLGEKMRKIISLFVTIPCLAFAVQTEALENITAKTETVAEDLSAPESKILTDFLWTKHVYAATKGRMATIKAAAASNLVTAHSSPVVVMPTINTPLFFGALLGQQPILHSSAIKSLG